jgi:hypothetical protein
MSLKMTPRPSRPIQEDEPARSERHHTFHTDVDWLNSFSHGLTRGNRDQGRFPGGYPPFPAALGSFPENNIARTIWLER